MLVEKLDAKCPDAIDKSTSDDEIEINIEHFMPFTCSRYDVVSAFERCTGS